MTGAALAEALRGAEDLYGALHQAAAGLTGAEVGGALDAALAALGDAPEAARLLAVDQGLLRAVLRHGAGLAATAHATAIRDWLAQASPSPLFRPEIASRPHIALLTAGERPDMPAFSDRAFDRWFAATGAEYGLGAYGENRSVYRSAQFADAASPERRTVHLGIDVFAPAGTPVHAPLAAEVAFVAYNPDPLDYGHTLILEHRGGDLPFWTLYGHLGGSLAGLCRPGQKVEAGQVIAHLGDWHENGGWAPHLHFQVMTDLLEQRGGNFFGVGHRSLWPVWQVICPDPNLILRLPEGAFAV
ncbi:MAG: peptidoglycan DD-metalloendopeptidase family protein [Tabrizicola sp.]|nr:peptidoglycan DD-metalloendopeptidase family protein [Tabrizicola sp.]